MGDKVFAGGDSKYGRLQSGNPDKQFFLDEPLFVLRGSDSIAPAAIRDYAMRARVCGCPDEHVNQCLAQADRIAAWQQANPNLVKLPD